MSSTISIDEGCPLSSPDCPNEWAEAAESLQRWNQVSHESTEEALSMGLTNDQAADYGYVTAWLDCKARNRRLRVERSITGKYNQWAEHRVSILEEVDGELNTIDCGGYAEMSELRRSGDENWPFEKEDLGDGWVRMDLMITDMFPDHEIFQRSDGSRIDLGFNDNEHYYIITVTMHQDDLIENF